MRFPLLVVGTTTVLTAVGAPALAATPDTTVTVSARAISQDTLRDPTLTGMAPAGRRATLQVFTGGRWRANRYFTVAPDGTYSVPLSYGRGAVAAFRHRVVVGRTVSPVVTVNRVAVLNPVVRKTTRQEVSASWRPGCPVHYRDLRTVTMNHWGFDGRMHRGTLVVADAVAGSAVAAFEVGIDSRFPIAKMREVSAYGADDDASMADNNTSAFNCRLITNGTTWSKHSYGRAIDINPVQNPYIYRATVSPAAGKKYTDRTNVHPGMMVASNPLTRAFVDRGWRWLSTYDYQHVEKP